MGLNVTLVWSHSDPKATRGFVNLRHKALTSDSRRSPKVFACPNVLYVIANVS
jgi:hypothetical protein